MVPTATKRIFRRRFPGTCETVGQVFKSVWRLCSKINVVCMSLSPFDSFQSRFVTYLLNFPRTTEIWWGKPKERDHMQDAGVDGRIVKWISERRDGKGWAGLIWFRTETSCGIV